MWRRIAWLREETTREAVEYGEYIEYLRSTGHLHPEIESLELEALQEVQGLRALRVRVMTDV